MRAANGNMQRRPSFEHVQFIRKTGQWVLFPLIAVYAHGCAQSLRIGTNTLFTLALEVTPPACISEICISYACKNAAGVSALTPTHIHARARVCCNGRPAPEEVEEVEEKVPQTSVGK